MAISAAEKKALEDHFHGKDVYDPSRAKEQKTADFAPRCEHGNVMGMCNGGMCEGGVKGYDDGGEVDLSTAGLDGDGGDFSAPMAANTDTAKAQAVAPGTQSPPLMAKIAGLFGGNPEAWESSDQAQPAPASSAPPLNALVNEKVAPQASLLPPNGPQNAQEGPQEPVSVPDMGGNGVLLNPANAAPPADQSKLSTDQMQQLIDHLSKPPTVGQRIAGGLAGGLRGFGDALMQAAGRGPGQSEKNAIESQHNQSQELLDAIRAKYEVGFKPQELAQAQERIAEELRHNQATESEAKTALGVNAQNLGLERQIQAGELGVNSQKAKVDAAQKIVDAYEKGNPVSAMLGLSTRPSDKEYNDAKEIIKSSGTVSGAGSSPPRIMSRGQFAALPKGAQFVDDSGKVKVKH